MDTVNISEYQQKMSIFRIGEVYSVDGRTIRIKVDSDKNLSHLIYQGSLIKNVSVGSYMKILKGFEALVCQVESEYIKENDIVASNYHNQSAEFSRYLNVKLLGYFKGKEYRKGVKDMPLIGNKCYLLDNEEFISIHKFSSENDVTIELGHLLNDDRVQINLSVSRLFTSHIGIFGNTGSGKSYTLAKVYNELFTKVGANKNFKENAKFLLFDFNGEYSGEHVIVDTKTVYKISTKHNATHGDRIPIKKEDLLNPELFNILANATEKTQQPFIKRTLVLYQNVQKAEYPDNYIKATLRKLLIDVVCMTDVIKSRQLLDYFEQILPSEKDATGVEKGLLYDLQWHGSRITYYTVKDGETYYFNSDNGRQAIKKLALYNAIDNFSETGNFIDVIIKYLYIQLILDVLNNRAQNEHISPAINKLKALRKDFDKVFEINEEQNLWNGNFMVVVDLNNANINIKKLVPLLISYKLYTEHKNAKEKKRLSSLNIIIDEAHNILSYESMRESESWKDFRLETFEEIIKEGRKFGVFMTIASQRPSDISSTIISQLHNYFIHRLINNKDLEMIEKVVAYLDKLSFETLPILPVGGCVMSGVIADLPIMVQVDKLDKTIQPQSSTIPLELCWLDK